MKVLLVFISLFSGVLLHAQHSIDALLKANNEDGIPYISVTEARMFQLHNKAIIFDAREREEFEVSAIPSAKYIGYKGFSPEEIAQTFLDKDKLVIVYCSVGIRSSTIAKKLKDLGFTNVKNLYGGIFEWKNKGFPVINQTGKETEKVHIYSKMWGKYLEKGIKVM
ncbi:rhodanese-like domain-containing protein [Aureisphaera sp. CAU 1614]|uniref:Rhodanese-like domain-containing protein n=1 Tax=Halomarinibacterium sedimenti TaxID=2857106 RepID=A0A9X1JUQ2_9FLAO|nr:rhodanese-like domain-containing protein [Halomarinibacterium sedimenti]MBW2936875.1 rhodanese-like domain-containing protein [Halomarinibacterium sedimenti]